MADTIIGGGYSPPARTPPREETFRGDRSALENHLLEKPVEPGSPKGTPATICYMPEKIFRRFLPDVVDNRFTLEAIGKDTRNIASLYLCSDIDMAPLLEHITSYFESKNEGTKRLWAFFEQEITKEKALLDYSVDQFTSIPQKSYIAGHLIKVNDQNLTVRIGLWTDGPDPDPVIEMLYLNPDTNERHFYTYRPQTGLSRKGESQKLTKMIQAKNPFYEPKKDLPIAHAIAESIRTGKPLEKVVYDLDLPISIRKK